ncbi:ATP-binding protein [Achromobacter ruhlandii]|uniref:hybrid sensor histidine kinase/response regulator n=1 Tax=Achromobacter ruhlandii TaxID=72557 RepID=UPI003B9E0649
MSTFTNRWAQSLALLAACLIATTMALFYWTVDREVSIEKEEMQKHFQYIVSDILALQDALIWATDIEEFDHLPLPLYPLKLARQRHQIDPALQAYSVTNSVTGLSSQLTFRSLGSEESNLEEAEAVSALSNLVLARFLLRLTRFEVDRLPINLLDLKEGRRAAFGCDLPFVGEAPSSRRACAYADDQLARVMRSRRKNANQVVFWSGFGGGGERHGLIAFAKVNEQRSFVQGDWWVSASLNFKDMPQFPHVVGGHGQLPSSYEVYSPEGELLTASIAQAGPLLAGVEFLRDSCIIEFTSKEGWKIRYRLSYINILRELYPQLAVLGLLLAVGCMAVYLFSRWYFRRYCQPAVQQRQRIIESEEFARGVIEVAQVAMCVVDRRTGKPLKVNALAKAWLGDDDNVQRLARNWVATYGAKGTGMQTVALNIGNRHFSGCFAHARYEEHDVLLCTLLDISAHVKAQESLEWEKRVADQSSAAKSAFLAMMSHEIRTPLYGVLGTLELLSETRLSPEQKGYLDTTQRSAGILLRIIGDVLDMSKIESGVIELNEAAFSPLELTEMVAQAYTATAINKALSLHCIISPEVPGTVLGDADRVRQVLNNLLSNAIKFTEIGRVRISLDAEPGADGRANLIWRVSDSGIGISSQDQARLFEPFFQVRAEPGMACGTGLGLAICKSLVDLMGGGIEVDSKLGDGSTFSVCLALPRVDDGIAVSPALDLPNVSVVVRAPTVELRRHYRQWLERWGVQCDGEDFEAMQGQERVLLNVSPELMTPLHWSGRQIVATERGPLQPQRLAGVVCVCSHSLVGLAQALSMAMAEAQEGGLSAERAVTDAQPRKLLDVPSLPTQLLRSTGLRVLLAEDSPINREVLKRQLKSLGCSVVIRSDGVSALKAWDADKFDVLLTDVNMPGLGGPELIGRLRQEGMDKPIICVTANAQVHQGRGAEYPGVDAWLVKPISLRALQECLLHTVVARLPSGGREPRGVSADPPGPRCIDEDIPGFLHGIFQSAMQVDLHVIRRCLDARDETGLWAAVHRIRGGLVMAGQEKMAQNWQELEERLETGIPLEEEDIERIQAAVGVLETLLNRLQTKTS